MEKAACAGGAPFISAVGDLEADASAVSRLGTDLPKGIARVLLERAR